MAKNSQSLQSSIPSVDKLLRLDAAQPLLDEYGHQMCTEALRQVIDETRRARADNGEAALPLTEEAAVIGRLNDRLTQMSAPSLRPVINLTGTVLHTNLGRAPLPQEAIDAMCVVAGGASNLEYDLASGKRGDRDTHIDDLLAEITGAEAATVVNNNAAAVLLVLNTLANRKEVPVSRGELIEIGGAFRIPDIIKRAGAKLVEIGTTNRTHLKDYAEAISPRTAALMKVHTSNYTVQGFTKEVTGKELLALAREHDLPLIEDLGSGTLVDLSRYGLPHEPTAQETLANGVDVVTFSGDKLLGGPQAGLIVGTKELVQKIKMNPMKRALRLDKVTIAALTAVLQLYRDPDRLAQRVPTIRLLARSEVDIRAVADRVKAPVADAFGENYVVRVVEVQSQIGSGSLPVERLPSVALAIEPLTVSRGSALKKLASAFRGLPIPVIGRIQDDAFLLDLRCLVDEDTFLGQLSGLGLKS
ncbi:MAG: L-seryl-tRNA(Sec) selenium transferase [Rhodospirillaceae bacterium]